MGQLGLRSALFHREVLLPIDLILARMKAAPIGEQISGGRKFSWNKSHINAGIMPTLRPNGEMACTGAWLFTTHDRRPLPEKEV